MSWFPPSIIPMSVCEVFTSHQITDGAIRHFGQHKQKCSSIHLYTELSWHGLAESDPQAKSSPLPIIKFYWNTATSFHLRIVSGCFSAAVADLSSYDTNHVVCKSESVCFLALYRNFANS